MQEFLVDRHTTPATPALNPVNVPKVPIYDTVADAEADLANLEVGQILKTKDAGLVANLNPIDEVKQGVFLPPTSNAVAKCLSYSTTEQKTGGKWIDGKDIYRKAYSGQPTNDQTLITIQNLDKVIKMEGCYYTSSGYWYMFGDGYSSTSYVRPYTYGNNVSIAWGTSIGQPQLVLLIIEYTKNE